MADGFELLRAFISVQVDGFREAMDDLEALDEASRRSTANAKRSASETTEVIEAELISTAELAAAKGVLTTATATQSAATALQTAATGSATVASAAHTTALTVETAATVANSLASSAASRSHFLLENSALRSTAAISQVGSSGSDAGSGLLSLLRPTLLLDTAFPGLTSAARSLFVTLGPMAPVAIALAGAFAVVALEIAVVITAMRKLISLGQNELKSIFSGGDGFISQFTEFERANFAFETFLGKGERAKELLQELQDFASGSIAQFPEVRESSQSLLSVVSDDQLLDRLTRLSDIAVGTGNNLVGLSKAFAAAGVSGKVTLDILDQFEDAGILETIAQQRGVSVQELIDLIRRGQVEFRELEAAIISITDPGSRFGGLLERQSATIVGLVDQIKDNVSLVQRTFGDFLKTGSGIGTILSGVSSVVQRFREGFSKFVDDARPVLSAFGESLGEFVRSLTELLAVISGSSSRRLLEQAFTVLSVVLAKLTTIIRALTVVVHNATQSARLWVEVINQLIPDMLEFRFVMSVVATAMTDLPSLFRAAAKAAEGFAFQLQAIAATIPTAGRSNFVSQTFSDIAEAAFERAAEIINQVRVISEDDINDNRRASRDAQREGSPNVLSLLEFRRKLDQLNDPTKSRDDRRDGKLDKIIENGKAQEDAIKNALDRFQTVNPVPVFGQ